MHRRMGVMMATFFTFAFASLILMNSHFTFASIKYQTPVPDDAQMERNGIYKLRRNIELIPKVEFILGKRIVSPEQESLLLNKNEPVSVEFGTNNNVLVHLLLTDEERGLVPEAIVIDQKEFELSDPEWISFGNREILAQKFSPYEEIQVASGQQTKFTRKRRDHYRSSNGGAYSGCVAYVCRAIGGCSGKVGNGKGMTKYLQGQRWRSVSCANPPIGAVASWSGGSHGLGHTAVWNGYGWCYDLGCGDPGALYHLRNCVAR